MLQFHPNAHADANIDARVNGPLIYELIDSIYSSSSSQEALLYTYLSFYWIVLADLFVV